jgi:RNA polymerase sigma-70 factor (ECF subfamily)
MAKARDDFDYEAALQACARGDQYALRAIYERERRWLMAVALRITRRRELAEEVLHDAFLQIWAKAGTFNAGLGSARGWIYSVVRHRALNLTRTSHRVVEVDDERLTALLDAHAAWRSASACSSRSSTAIRTSSSPGGWAHRSAP